MQAQATAPDQIIAKSGSEHLVRGSNAREIQQGERIAFARSSSGKSSPVIERKKKEAKTKTVSPKTSEGIIEERDKDAALDTDDTIWPPLVITSKDIRSLITEMPKSNAPGSNRFPQLPYEPPPHRAFPASSRGRHQPVNMRPGTGREDANAGRFGSGPPRQLYAPPAYGQGAGRGYHQGGNWRGGAAAGGSGEARGGFWSNGGRGNNGHSQGGGAFDPPSSSSSSSGRGRQYVYPGSDTEDIVQPARPQSPNPWDQNTIPFTSAYQWTISHPDPRTNVPDWILKPDPDLIQLNPNDSSSLTSLGHSAFSLWAASAPSQKTQRAVKRILRDLNKYIKKEYPREQFVVEPFGSVSWGAETSESGDLDLVLRDFARPQGYTPNLWSDQELSARDMPTFYKVFRLADLLRRHGYENIEPIKWASTPIVQFDDPRSGMSVDLQANDLGGWMNSQLLLAYCRISPYLLRPLIYVVKRWAKARRLNNPSGQGGGPQTLSSYCWCLMCISYLQITGRLPNLQEEELVEQSGRTNAAVYVGWNNAQGQKVEVGFAGGEVLDVFVPNAIPQTAVEDLGEAVKGFFEMMANATTQESNDGVVRHDVDALSVWKGGRFKRYHYLTAEAKAERRDAEKKAQRLEQLAREEANNANGLGAGSGVGGSSQQRQQPQQRQMGRMEKLSKRGNQPIQVFPEMDGFCQPQKWADHDLVVQDPFIHDKNCAGALVPATFLQISMEFARANHILQRSGTLEELFEAAQIPLTKKQKQAQQLLEQQREALREAAKAQGGSERR